MTISLESHKGLQSLPQTLRWQQSTQAALGPDGSKAGVGARTAVDNSYLWNPGCWHWCCCQTQSQSQCWDLESSVAAGALGSLWTLVEQRPKNVRGGAKHNLKSHKSFERSPFFEIISNSLTFGAFHGPYYTNYFSIHDSEKAILHGVLSRKILLKNTQKLSR